MVNTKTLFSAVVLGSALYAIATYMKKNNLNTNDISFIDVCWKAEAEHGGMNETCTMAEESKMDWDTPTACFGDFAPEKYYFTPRQMMGLQGVSRRMKSEDDVVKAVYERKYEDPNMCKVTPAIKAEFDEHIAQLKSGKKDEWASALVVAGLAYIVVCALSYYGNCHNYGFYKACSTNPGFFIGLGSDWAECSSKTNGHHCTDGHSSNRGHWWGTSRHWKNRLNNACIIHDDCLAWSWHGSNGGCCDKVLASAGGACMWPWDSCNDSKMAGAVVWSIMSCKPNGPCPPPPTPRRRGGWGF